MLKRIASATVWAPNGVRAEDWRFRGIYRFVLPVTDILFFWFGAAGWYNGVASVQDAAGIRWQEWWSLSLALAAAVAFVGIAFPRLWLVEVMGKIPLIALVFVYIVITFARGLSDPNIIATSGIIAILILLPIWRVGDLGFAAWLRKTS